MKKQTVIEGVTGRIKKQVILINIGKTNVLLSIKIFCGFNYLLNTDWLSTEFLKIQVAFY